ncbi:Acid proteinase, putative [Kitasatospora sp. MMS16-BH015]|uniref:G1 family glutamic endopeptidase n=1 Tax=Kitasatospora sp. MMS16-BH015 TaxID=2018025 RepID=UPI000CA15088|nr:G1 family glutamic endopeptidase [Kitasatospora sp. MMS16-BH015]AUG81504.1 Acid proteinase, putative [Kitasatospora sp. MMS16-BH015]
MSPRSRTLALLATTALSLATALSATAPATAASHYHGSHARKHADNIWGGYVTYGSTFKTVSGTWNIPALDCTNNKGIASPWVGLDGWDSDTVEQIGIDFDCSTGKPQYNTWVEMYPQNSIYFSEPVQAGDSMTGTVTDNGSHRFTLTLSDPTKGWTKTYQKTLSSSTSVNAEAIMEPIGSGSVPTLAKFGPMQFTGVTVDGQPISSYATHQSTVTRGTTVLATTGALSGSAFAMTWRHA